MHLNLSSWYIELNRWLVLNLIRRRVKHSN